MKEKTKGEARLWEEHPPHILGEITLIRTLGDYASLCLHQVRDGFQSTAMTSAIQRWTVFED